MLPATPLTPNIANLLPSSAGVSVARINFNVSLRMYPTIRIYMLTPVENQADKTRPTSRLENSQEKSEDKD
jgi:hypothetical protein